MTAITRDRSELDVDSAGASNLVLQDQFLADLAKGRVPVQIFLVNGIRLQGEIERFDQYGLVLRGASDQFVYKHAISTILPVRNETHHHSGDETAGTERRPTTLHARKPRF